MNLIPSQPESYYEIGYILMGKGFIYFIAFFLLLQSTGLMMIYLNVLGDILKTLVKKAFLGAE